MPQKRIKIASVSLNQTVYDYATNIAHHEAAIDEAVNDGADILATQELSLTGYAADDYHQWNKNNDQVWAYVSYLAHFAAARNPNLVLTVGAPWHYADKDLRADDPAYNINNRPFNAHFIITQGRVVAIAAKSILADGPAEYEPRQFSSWPSSKGTIAITLPDGSRVPFGKPVVFLGGPDGYVSLAIEICADGWPGVHDNLTINHREQREVRHIIALSKLSDLSVVLNPSASKPEPAINKERIRAEGLCKTGSQHCGIYVYTNVLGSDSGTYAAEGSQIFAQGGKITHHGQRYAFKEVSYSSAVVDVPVAHGRADAIVEHVFGAHAVSEMKGAEAPFDRACRTRQINKQELVHEEYMHTIALWLRDYLAKQTWPAQGYVISLSGGKDSAFGALAVSTMVDLDVRENGVEGFCKRFSHLAYKDKILETFRREGQAAAVRAIKYDLLTCIYMPTENSSERTQRAARFLIEGGSLPDGRMVPGIGGKFYVAPAQNILNEATVAFTGLNLDEIAATCTDEILHGELRGLSAFDRQAVARARAMQEICNYISAAPGTHPSLPSYITKRLHHRMPTWSNPRDDLVLQNLQPRIRVPIPWAVANREGKMALVTSNESEAVLGYATAGGDMHMGGANPIGGMPKQALTDALLYLEDKGLVGQQPIHSLYWVNKEMPSAELRQETAGTPQQTDEGDIKFTYMHAQFIEERLLVGRQTPMEVLLQMSGSDAFPRDEEIRRDILLNFTRRWEAAPFKRIMSVLSPHIRANVDPHQAVRTTVLGDHFRTYCALMTLDILAERTGGTAAFEHKYGLPLAHAKLAAGINGDFKKALLDGTLETLSRPENWTSFAKRNREVLRYA